MSRAIVLSTVFAASLVSFFSQKAGSSEPIVDRWEERTTHKWISTPIKSWLKSGIACDLYQRYWVVFVPYADRVGSDISVFKRDEKILFPKGCDLKLEKAWVRYQDNDYGSASIDKDVLFLDSGTGNWRGLQIINLEDRRQITSIGYNRSVGEFSLDNDQLTYKGPLDRKEKARSSWAVLRKCLWEPQHKPKEWFQENYEGTRRINIKTGKETTSEVTCDIGPVAG